MDSRDSEFLKRIQATFRIEAGDHLKALSSGLIEMEKRPSEPILSGIIENMFREVHSLKGAARSIGQKDIESVCQPLESLFATLKRKEIPLNQEILDLFFKTSEILTKLIPEEPEAEGKQEMKEIIQQLRQAVNDPQSLGRINPAFHQEKQQTANIKPAKAVSPEPVPAVDPVKYRTQALEEAVRIPISKLDPLLLQAEEFLQAKISFIQQTDEIRTILNDLMECKTETQNWRRRKSRPTLEEWNEWFENFELRLNHLGTQLALVSGSMQHDQYVLERMVNDHLDAMKQVLMLPVSSLVEVFPPMVRKIARDQHKEIDFTIHGAELEIDKRILEELKDPLIHLIRNSIDHGIDIPEVRKQQNKTPRGKINLSFLAKASGHVEVTISDDGKGVNKEQVLKAAVKAGIISSESAEKMNPDEIPFLIFQSGVSTSPIITDLSGRGLGLSIVREKVEKLNGRLSLDTEEHKGTVIKILLPMTLATFRGILIRLGESMFIVPTMNVVHVIRLQPDAVKTVENHETVRIDDSVIPLVDLAKVLGLPKKKNGTSRLKTSETKDFIRAIVLALGENRIAFKVDEILDEHQVLVKGLGKLLKRVRNISGATILGSGKIVPVLHVSDLMKSVSHAIGKGKEAVTEEINVPRSEKILVAEDSITSRTLLKNILENAGYLVTVAVDGYDAYIRAKSDEFDLVVSDVDMPRMNGFELTSKIRGDKNLSEIPVVLVTSLESRDDRERGIEAGANAYIIKSSFDQGNLLDVIKKLI